MSAATAILIRERKVVGAFRDASATAPEAARSLEQLGLRDDLAFGRLRRRAVVREVDDGRYYLDAASWDALRGTRRRRVAIALAVAAAVGLVYWLIRTMQ